MSDEACTDEAIEGMIAQADPQDMLAAIRAERERRQILHDTKQVVLRDQLLAEIGGSDSPALNTEIGSQVIASAWNGPASAEEQGERAEANIAAIRGIAPADPIEGMLSAQFIAMHNATMEMLRRAALPGQKEAIIDASLGHANRLARSAAALVQTLDKHRSRGQQTVRVEHVHVHSGGQAIVGPVHHGAAGGGGGNEGGVSK